MIKSSCEMCLGLRKGERDENHIKRWFCKRICRSKKQVQKLTDGIVVRPKGRPTKDGEMIPPSIQQLSKVSQLQYELARKEARIKALEMENELMRDFLSLTERK